MLSMRRLSDHNPASLFLLNPCLPNLFHKFFQLNLVVKFILHLMTLNQIYPGA